jgi:hypothetical protein
MLECLKVVHEVVLNTQRWPAPPDSLIGIGAYGVAVLPYKLYQKYQKMDGQTD